MNTEQKVCEHNWINKRGNNYIKCFNCGYYPSIEKRSQCNICFKEIFYLCLKKLFDIDIRIETEVKKKAVNNELYTEKLEKLEIIMELHKLKIQNLKEKIRYIEETVNNKSQQEFFEVTKCQKNIHTYKQRDH